MPCVPTCPCSVVLVTAAALRSGSRSASEAPQAVDAATIARSRRMWGVRKDMVMFSSGLGSVWVGAGRRSAVEDGERVRRAVELLAGTFLTEPLLRHDR